MSTKIRKINNLKKIQGFIEVKFSKGFKYIDRAGEFLNCLHEGDTVPKYAMDINGLIAKTDEKTQLKTSPHHLWMQFMESDSFDFQRKNFVKKNKLVNNIFEPEKYNRVGWRNYFAYECGDAYPNIVPGDYLKDVELSEITFTKKISDFEVRVNVSKIIKEGSDDKAILFDVDIYKKIDIPKEEWTKINILLSKMEDTYKSKALLDIINEILK